MSKELIEIGPMTRAEVLQLERWAIDEGWNPGIGDVELAWRFDPQAFIAMREAGEMIGGGAILAYGRRCGFMGLFIMAREHRGRGLGSRLWHERLARLRARLDADAPIGMDGVFAMVPFYQRGGFRLAWRDLRFAGRAATRLDAGAHQQVVDLAAVEFEVIDHFDRMRLPAPRTEFLRGWLGRPGVMAAGIPDSNGLRAFGVLRPAQTGYKFGPLFASSPEDARAIFETLCARVPGEPIELDVPEANPDAVALARAQGLSEVFGCARMFEGPMPAIDPRRIYGLTSFEFG
jgi:GNAT superfamily N-acetyltransferase